MPTYLYCVLTPGSDPPAAMPRGLDGLVRVLDAGAVTAWVETVGAPLAPTIDRIRIHDSVTEAAMATGVTPVPARFGQMFSSDEVCTDALRSRARRLLADLARVQGMVEMRVIARLVVPPLGAATAAPGRSPPDEPHTPGPGRDYLQHLRDRRNVERNVHSISAAVRQRLTETVGAFVRGEAISLDPLPAAVLRASHLVRRDEVSRYRSALLDATLGPEVERIVVSGPGAPYRFVSDPDE